MPMPQPKAKKPQQKKLPKKKIRLNSQILG
jgi:hypothetical protein